jgi:hypothetical protein
MPGSRKPTDDFEANWQDEKPPSYQQQIDSSRPDEAHETVRRGFTYDTVITAESDEGASEATLPFQSQAGRARPDLTVREAIDGDPRSNAKDEEFQVGLSSKPGLLESPRTNNNQA